MSWTTSFLEDVIDVRDGTHDSPKYVAEGYPLVTSKNIVGGELFLDSVNYISEEDFRKINQRSKVDIGDIIMPMIGTIGNPHLIVNEPNFAIKNVALFKVGDGQLKSKFLLYLLNSSIVERQLKNNSRGGTQKFVSLKNLRSLKVPLPPLKEQHRIVELLDRAQALIDKRKEQIALMDQLVQSLFYDMFGDPVTNPKGWEIVPSIKYSTSIVPGRDKPKSFTGAIPWVTTDDLVHLGRTTVSKKGLGLTGFEIKQVKAKIIPKSSVIMTCVGDLGVVSINECDMVVNQQLHAFQCDTNWLNPTFLMYNLACQTPYMHQMASSTTVPYMNKKVANNTPTIAPPVELQNTFAERVQQIETQKQAMTNSLKELQDNFNSLSQRAFKGELTQ